MTRSPCSRRFVLINPNTDAAVTESMVAIARSVLRGEGNIEGVTASFGASLILDPVSLATAGLAATALASAIQQLCCDGVIVSAFGDPGLDGLRSLLACPVTGLAEASMARAGEGGRRFCVVTTTPDLGDAIAAAACRYGHGSNFAGSFYTPGDPTALMYDPVRLEAQLHHVCERVVKRQEVEAIIIGGGPLAVAARALAGRLPVPLVEPIREAVAMAIARAPLCSADLSAHGQAR